MAQPLHVVRVPHGDHVASSRSTVATNGKGNACRKVFTYSASVTYALDNN